MTRFDLMSYRDDRAVIHSLETGRGRRVAILVAAFLAVVIVLWSVSRGFHGRQIRRDARALTDTPAETSH